MAAGNLMNAALAVSALVVVAWLCGAAWLIFIVTQFVHGLEEGKAGTESFGAGRAKMGADLRVTSIQTNQTKQTNSTKHSNSPVSPGQVGL